MSDWDRNGKNPRTLLALGICTGALFAFGGTPLAQMSEIDAFQLAVSSQDEADAEAFLREFESSHLAGDLIELLSPDVALGVCGSLVDGSSRAGAACDRLQLAVAVQPAAGPAPPAEVDEGVATVAQGSGDSAGGGVGGGGRVAGGSTGGGTDGSGSGGGSTGGGGTGSGSGGDDDDGDGNNGHGNDADGNDEGNPGRGPGKDKGGD